ncbi:MAG: fasciclin domain-containing protein [Saprospiraceae bacterium]|nr:fasciclin domain-containing protein [Candidatus Vicinibacter affinis]
MVNSPIHNTLEAAAGAAGLVPTLQSAGPFTIFAYRCCLCCLPPGTVEALLKDPQGVLTQILLYHAVGAKALSTDLTNGQLIKTINGQSVNVTINTDGVFINNAKVIVADVLADNGVVHVIDAVLTPQFQ